jgi:hypothetical protein
MTGTPLKSGDGHHKEISPALGRAFFVMGFSTKESRVPASGVEGAAGTVMRREGGRAGTLGRGVAEGGRIRTSDTVARMTYRDVMRRLRPLSHPSGSRFPRVNFQVVPLPPGFSTIWCAFVHSGCSPRLPQSRVARIDSR